MTTGLLNFTNISDRKMDDMVFQTENNNLNSETNDDVVHNDTSKGNNYFNTEESTDQPYLIPKMENIDLVIIYFIFFYFRTI